MPFRLQSFCAILLGFVYFAKPVESEYVVVRNWCTGEELGAIRGSLMETRSGRNFHAFRGIPYAKPPINSLRFRDPIPFEPWQGVLDATEDAPMCPQSTYNASYVMSEDCLFLNVYTRQFPKTIDEPKKPLPVIVYIHPGYLLEGSGTSEHHAGPQYLLDRNIVLVTFNYRLGALGFLSTGTEDCPGNLGLKDQVVVLKWVHDYIGNFGGDPNSVTIFGYSAGGVSGTLHMVSPMSRGLFHRVIIMGGVITYVKSVPHDQLDLARRQARIFNCPETNLRNMVRCLRKVDAIELALSVPQLYDFAGSNPNRPFVPVIERKYGQQRFLPDDPTELFQSGHLERVPVMVGLTKYEHLKHVLPIIRSPEYLQQLNDNFTELAPICFIYDSGTEQSRIASDIFRKTFLPGPIRNDNQTVIGLDQLFSDGIVGFPTHRFVSLTCQHIPVYYYESTYVGRYTVVDYANGAFRPVHYDDLLYLMVLKVFAPPYTASDRESLTIERMTRLWTQFAKTGNPNRRHDKYLHGVAWHQSSCERHEYLEIGDELVMKEFLNRERYSLWDRLFPLRPLSFECD